MALDNDLMFIGQEAPFEAYNGIAILNLSIVFQNSDETDFTFPGYVSAYFNIYQSRGESQLKSFASQIIRSSNVFILNLSVSDMTFADNGTYYYELGYIQSGGYAVPLRFGVFKAI